MTRFFLLMLLVPIAGNSLRGQEDNSLNTFFSHLTEGQPSHAYFDTYWEDPATFAQSPKHWYYELLELDGQWFFYQHSYVPEKEIGFQRFCACELEEFQQHLEDQVKADSSRTNVTSYFYYLPFSSEKCISSYGAGPLHHSAPMLAQLLTGELNPPLEILDTLSTELNAQVLSCVDDRWILDLEIEVPDSLEIYKLLDQHLFYFGAEDETFFPAPDIPAWKADLIKNGLFAQQLLQFRGIMEEWERIRFRQLDTDDPAQRINVQMLVPVKKVPQGGHAEAAGRLKLAVTNGTQTTLHQKLGRVEAGKPYELRLDEQGTVYVDEITNAPVGGGLWFHHSSLWRKLVFYEAGGDTIARFDRGEEPKTLRMNTVVGKTYMAQVTGLSSRSVLVPFAVKLPIDHLIEDAASAVEVNQQYASFYAWGEGSDNDKVYLNSYLELHDQQEADTFLLTTVFDDTGKDLLANQVDSLEAFYRWAASVEWVPPSNLDSIWADGYRWKKHRSGPGNKQYSLLEVRLWDQPAATASSIFLQGEFQFHQADGAIRRIPWADTLRLGMTLPFEPEHQPQERPAPAAALSATSFTLGSAEEAYNQGLGAYFELALSPDQVFVRLDMENSSLQSLYDNQGYDLLLLEEQMKDWNRRQNKRSASPNVYSYLNLLSDGDIYWSANGDVTPFRIQCRATPTLGATQVFGRATVAYSTFSPELLLAEEFSIPYEEQKVIELMVGSTLLRYERSPFPQEINNRSFRQYSLQTEGLDIFAGMTVLLEDGEVISPSPDEVYEIHHLYIPDDYDNSTLKIGVLYGDLQHHQTTLDLEVSINGTMK